MSEERLGQAREQLRQKFIAYVEGLAVGAVASKDIDDLIKLRHAIDALDHAIDEAWAAPRVDPPRNRVDPFDEVPGG
jgi:hypothetical protein